MNTFFATFTTGLSQPVLQFLKAEASDCKIDYLLDGLISFRTMQSYEELDNLGIFNNIFQLIKTIKVDKITSFDRAVQMLLEDSSWFPFQPIDKNINGHPLRIVFSDKNQMVSIEKKVQEQLQKRLASFKNEFWLIKRTEGVLFFGIRLTHHGDYEKLLQPGELRPELCSIMCRLSKPNENDIFLDPFAGSGAIVKRRLTFPYQKILVGEKDHALITKLKQTLNANVEILSLDALNLHQFEKESVTKIVTDPPWGHYGDQSINLNNFYAKMLSEFFRILKPDGLAVLLVARKEPFENLLKQFNTKFATLSVNSVLVSGRSAAIFVLKRI